MNSEMLKQDPKLGNDPENIWETGPHKLFLHALREVGIEDQDKLRRAFADLLKLPDNDDAHDAALDYIFISTWNSWVLLLETSLEAWKTKGAPPSLNIVLPTTGKRLRDSTFGEVAEAGEFLIKVGARGGS